DCLCYKILSSAYIGNQRFYRWRQLYQWVQRHTGQNSLYSFEICHARISRIVEDRSDEARRACIGGLPWIYQFEHQECSPDCRWIGARRVATRGGKNDVCGSGSRSYLKSHTQKEARYRTDNAGKVGGFSQQVDAGYDG